MWSSRADATNDEVRASDPGILDEAWMALDDIILRNGAEELVIKAEKPFKLEERTHIVHGNFGRLHLGPGA